mmetsp:Transcript_10682/g.23784  ORF Transcript_10682/g.23784 Transcript_10682/m.23784 type:complete len:404 (-) Transcript_10682:20-1231(-)
MFLARRRRENGPSAGCPSTAAELLVLENLHELTSGISRQPLEHAEPRAPARPRSAGTTPNQRRVSRGTPVAKAPPSSDAAASQPLSGGRHKLQTPGRPQSAPGGRRLSGSARPSLRERVFNLDDLKDVADVSPMPCPFSPATRRRYHSKGKSPEMEARQARSIGGLTARAAPWLFSVPAPLDDPRWYRSAEAQVMGLNYFHGMIKLVDLYSSKVATDAFMRSEASKAAASRAAHKAQRRRKARREEEPEPSSPLAEAMENATKAAAAQTLRPRREAPAEGVAIFVNGEEVKEEDDGEASQDSWMEQRLWTGKSLEALDELRHASVGTDVLRLEAALRRARAEHIEKLGPDGQELLADSELKLRQLWPLFDAPGDAAEGWLARTRTGSKMEPEAAALQRTRSSR